MLYNPKYDKKLDVLPAWKDMILRAADMIDKHGLCKKLARNAAGEHCMTGALQDCGGLTYRGVDVYWDAVRALDRAAQQRGFVGAVAFNNDPLTTKRDVVSFMREVAI